MIISKPFAVVESCNVIIPYTVMMLLKLIPPSYLKNHEFMTSLRKTNNYIIIFQIHHSLYPSPDLFFFFLNTLSLLDPFIRSLGFSSIYHNVCFLKLYDLSIVSFSNHNILNLYTILRTS